MKIGFLNEKNLPKTIFYYLRKLYRRNLPLNLIFDTYNFYKRKRKPQEIKKTVKVRGDDDHVVTVRTGFTVKLIELEVFG